MNRRRIARLIRVRQEMWKRFERLRAAPRWRGAADTLGVLDASVRAAVKDAPGDGLSALARHLRETAPSRYPLTHLAHRDPHTLPDVAAVVEDAERVLRGDWDVLGHALHIDARSIEWRAHPFSGTPTPTSHFSRVPVDATVLGGDVKFLWEINRHAELVRLGQGYWITRRPDFANTAVQLLDSWLDQNPPACGINWISCVDVAFRTIAWCWLWQLTSDSTAWTDARIGRLLWGVAHAARFIARYDSVHHSPNTHLTGEALGLVYISTVFPQLRGASRWRRLGIDILTEEVGRQFLADGVHYERCTGYHRYNLEFFFHSLAIARSSNERWAESFVGPLTRGVEASVHLRRPDGTWPVLGDEDGGSCVRLGTKDITDQSDLLAATARLVARPDLVAGIAPAASSSSLAWWALADHAVHASEPPERPPMTPPSTALVSAGYFSARDDWSEHAWYALVDAGPHGGDLTGHAHTDLGHVEIAHGKEWITVDPGCSLYNGDAERRNWYRRQIAHGCLVLDATELAIPGARPFRWASVAPTPEVDVSDEGSHWYCRLWYEYATRRGRVVHERQIVLVRGCGVIVCDLLTGTGTHDVVVRWPLAVPRSRATICEGPSALVGNSVISWFSSAPTPLTSTVEESRRSPKFGEEMDASTLILSQRVATTPFAFATAFTRTGIQPVAARWTGETMELTIALATDADAGVVRLWCHPNQAPRVERPG